MTTILEAAIQASEPQASMADAPDPLFNRVVSTPRTAGPSQTILSRQWSRRPPEARFTSLDSLREVVRAERERSISRVIPAAQIVPVALESGGIAFKLPGGKMPRVPTDWAFGQLAAAVSAPPQYLASLPESLAVQALQYGIGNLGSAELQTLETAGKNEGDSPTLRALTSRGYGRIWDLEILGPLQELAGSGTGEAGWTVPTAFRRPDTLALREARPVTVEDSTIYRGDRDLWIFLADESRPIAIGVDASGNPDLYFRGFAISNSEVGSGAFSVVTFLYHFICGNRMVWGGRNAERIVVRHSANAPARFQKDVIPALREYAAASVLGIETAIKAAKAKRVAADDDSRLAFLAGLKFSKSECAAILDEVLAQTQGRPMETAWDAAEGITAYARSIPYQADRVQVERVAAKLVPTV